MSTPIIPARFSGRCALCEARWSAGTPIAPFGAKSKRGGQWGHPACVAADEMGAPSVEAAKRRLSAIRESAGGASA